MEEEVSGEEGKMEVCFLMGSLISKSSYAALVSFLRSLVGSSEAAHVEFVVVILERVGGLLGRGWFSRCAATALSCSEQGCVRLLPRSR